jgi:hypothetical protein
MVIARNHSVRTYDKNSGADAVLMHFFRKASINQGINTLMNHERSVARCLISVIA